jgi:thioredoxin reductase
MERHLELQETRVLFEEVVGLDIAGDRTGSGSGGFCLATSQRDVHCGIVLIASGTRAREPEGLGIPDAVSDRVFTEVYPIKDVQGKHIVIVGSGDAAFDYAFNLSGENKVSVLNRSEKTRCLPLLRDRANAIGSIAYHDRTLPVRIENLGESGIKVECEGPGGDLIIEADYLLLAIGREPRLDFLTDRLIAQVDSLGRDGLLHLIGDVEKGIMRQTAIAVGDGIRAAVQTHSKLLELRA